MLKHVNSEIQSQEPGMKTFETSSFQSGIIIVTSSQIRLFVYKDRNTDPVEICKGIQMLQIRLYN